MNGRHIPAAQAMQPDMGRRRPYNHHQPYQPVAPMYNGGYYQPYATSYYPQMQPQYPNGAIPPAQYNPYAAYGRSPPPQMQPYVPAPPPMPSYPRQHASPAASTTYQPPPPHTPSSTQSSHVAPAPLTPPTSQLSQVAAPEPSPVKAEAFQPPLPWFSRPDLPWPTKQARIRRKKRPHATQAVEVTSAQPKAAVPLPEPTTEANVDEKAELEVKNGRTEGTTSVQSEEPTSSPSSASKPSKSILPVVPAIPKPTLKDPVSEQVKEPESQSGTETETATADTAPTEASVEEEKSVPSKARPSLWTGLFKASEVAAPTHGSQDGTALNIQKSTSESVAEVLNAFVPNSRDTKVSFLKPRGLVNTGNMCYMNSVLQVLVFCIPFYNFLDQVGKRAPHSFKSDTPLIDSMIMFMGEFPIIDSAPTVEQLRQRLKDSDLEQYGDPFTPEFVYDVIRRLPRFSSMRRGHQQDAEEFLGFLLEGLHDECAHVIRSNSSNASSALGTPANGPASPTSDTASIDGADGAWLEVGPKQKAAITRSSGSVSTTPITKIFGGTLRSELRIPGLKTSVTLEPYQPLQLDIGDPQIHNIVDALKGLTRPELLHGDFKSPKGARVTATKQVFIETLPPVLILHLKRFQYDNTGGTQKIWKKIGYPLELEIPKEVFSRQQQGKLLSHGGLPKYRLIAVVYHHGKNASGGHYTVDVRRQDAREWIRLDDTVIRRVRSEDVAQAGGEEEPKSITTDSQKRETRSGNFYDQIKDDGDESDNEGWKQVSAVNGNGEGKKWASVVNGSSTPKTKTGNSSIKDHEVPYLFFYERIN